MPTPIHYIPIATTILTILFAPAVFKRWSQKKPAPHLFWWGLGIVAYGLGTFTEGFTTLFGWHESVFRALGRHAAETRGRKDLPLDPVQWREEEARQMGVPAEHQ